MPNPTKRIKSDDENCVAIPSFEKLRIAQLVGKSFDLELFDGTELLEKYETSINPQFKDKKLSDKYLSLKFNLPVHKIGFFDDEKILLVHIIQSKKMTFLLRVMNLAIIR
ncbi:MAG: hypothetical protein FJX30_00560 [Alphaproteobacteria bacterium]|nr:hypothetical protein [Alphaproteobacteria bacterium]